MRFVVMLQVQNTDINFATTINPVSNLIALSALSFLLGRLIGCLGVCAIDDSTY